MALGLAAAALAGVVALASLGALPTLTGGSAGPIAAMDAPRFVDETASAGIDLAYDGGFQHFVGGGIAVFDCDQDDRPDLYIAGGERSAALYRNSSRQGAALRFEHRVDAATDLDAVTGAYPLDVDGDGLLDLAVLRAGENVMLRGLGDCRFERANEAWGIDGGNDWTTSFSATWEGDAMLPTLAFGNYLALPDEGIQDYSCADGQLIRPDGGDGYAAPLALTPSWCTLSMLFSDWDRSGRRDLRVSNDRHYYRDGAEQLWRITPGEPPHEYTEQDGWQTLRIWGMGIASQDITGDGLPEVFLTSQGDNKLQTLTDGATGPHYRDIALSREATAHRPFAGDTELPSTAWHAEFEDVNHDGYMDLFVTKGNVEAMTEYAARDPNDLLLGQEDGTFRQAAEEAGIVSFARSRGAALVDLDLDGMLDLVVVNRREPVQVWRNVGAGDADEPKAMGRWVSLRLVQPGSNRDAIGAWIEIRVGDRTIHRELTIGGGHAGGQLGWTHVGLGTADRAEVRVIWPDGHAGPWQSIEADRFVVIDRGGEIRTVEHREE